MGNAGFIPSMVDTSGSGSNQWRGLGLGFMRLRASSVLYELLTHSHDALKQVVDAAEYIHAC